MGNRLRTGGFLQCPWSALNHISSCIPTLFCPAAGRASLIAHHLSALPRSPQPSSRLSHAWMQTYSALLEENFSRSLIRGIACQHDVDLFFKDYLPKDITNS